MTQFCDKCEGIHETPPDGSHLCPTIHRYRCPDLELSWDTVRSWSHEDAVYQIAEFYDDDHYLSRNPDHEVRIQVLSAGNVLETWVIRAEVRTIHHATRVETPK